MNILYVLQQSIYNNEGKWITADSNINMMIGMLREAVKKTDWHFYILISPLEDFADLHSYDELIPDIKNKNQITFIPYDFPVDAFLNRQHFNVVDFNSTLASLPKIDVVWNNITELSRNIKTILKFKSPDTKLVTCCYWLDAPEIGQEKVDKDISYAWRQFDGFECSDLVVFTCKSTKAAFFENAKLMFNRKYVNAIKAKSTIWDFGFSKKEADKYDPHAKYDKPTILFLNRLSGINYTHHEEFIEALKILETKGVDYQVAFTNPSGKVDNKWLSENIKNLVQLDTPLSRRDYFALLWKANISVHLYNKELYGGVAHRESLYCKNTVITPKVNEYLNIQGEDYPYYTQGTPNDLAEVLYKALKTNMPEDKWSEIRKRNLNSSFEKVIRKVMKDMEAL